MKNIVRRRRKHVDKKVYRIVEDASGKREDTRED